MIGERLRLLREEKEKQQNEVADELGINRVTYNRYEKGSRQPSLETIAKLATYFSVTTDFIIGTINQISEEEGNFCLHETIQESVQPHNFGV